MPKSRRRKNAPASQHRAMPKAVQAQADAMTHLPETTTPK